MAIIGPFYVHPNTFPYYLIKIILNNPLIFSISILLGMILSYLTACMVDNNIKNQSLKVVIATISGIITILIVYFFYKLVTEPVICDPVHLPQNNTVSDPVHQHGQENIYSLDVLRDIQVDSQSVQDSYHQCINNLGYK